MLRNSEGPVIDLFHRLNLNLQAVKTELEQRVREDEIGMPIHTTDLVLNEKASNILKLAVLEARIQRTTKVDEQHLLLAILHDAVNNGAKQVLELNNMNYEDAMAMLFAQKNNSVTNNIDLPDEEEDEFEDTTSASANTPKAGAPTTTQKKPASKTPVLDTFGTDLTQAAAEGKLDPCVGREREIQRIIEILGRRKKNNPILL
jgi:ATP-dependent Clp protease ATP-binding subunit ClpC